MANYNLPCEIIQDLLPSYIDGLTNEITNQAIEEHLTTCEVCRSILERMREPEKKEETAELQEEKIDYLKKTKTNTKKKIYASVLITVLVVMVLIAGKLYFVGESVYQETVAIDVEVSDEAVDISGSLVDKSKGVSDIQFEEQDGILNVVLKSTLASSFHENKFEAQYQVDRELIQICMDDRILWDQGKNISAEVSEVYNTKHLYVGDMSANGATATALRIAKVLGNFTSELDTKREPYGWKLVLEEWVLKDEWVDKTYKMKSYAYVLLAAIENLSYVEFEYKTENGVESLYFSKQDATESLGKDIKECAESPADLQILMERMGLTKVINIAETAKTTQVDVLHDTEMTLTEVQIRYLVDGESYGVKCCMMVGDTSFVKNQVLPFEFLQEELQNGKELVIEIEAKDKEGKVYKTVSEQVNIEELQELYSYTLSGNAEDGLKLGLRTE